MKKLTVLLLLLLTVFLVNAQSFGELEWQKTKIPAIVVEVPYSSSITEAAIKQKLTQLGYNGKETKGVTVYKGIRIAEISSEAIDLYLSVERKSRKDKDESVVYFAISKGLENYVKSGDDAILISRINSYTSNFSPWAEAEALERDIKDQEDKLKSAEKRDTDLKDESENLQKRLKKLNEDIETNKKNIEKQKTEVENQRKALDILKAKRKS
jgi:lipopolysaccharide export LptBFGC system permease protein LptF